MAEEDDLTYRKADALCPDCGAEPGTKCVAKTGALMNRIHPARDHASQQMAAAAAGGTWDVLHGFIKSTTPAPTTPVTTPTPTADPADTETDMPDMDADLADEWAAAHPFTDAAAARANQSNFDLAAALVMEIEPGTQGGDTTGEARVTAELKKAAAALTARGRGPYAVATLKSYRLTAIRFGARRDVPPSWLPGVSFGAHEAAASPETLAELVKEHGVAGTTVAKVRATRAGGGRDVQRAKKAAAVTAKTETLQADPTGEASHRELLRLTNDARLALADMEASLKDGTVKPCSITHAEARTALEKQFEAMLAAWDAAAQL